MSADVSADVAARGQRTRTATDSSCYCHAPTRQRTSRLRDARYRRVRRLELDSLGFGTHISEPAKRRRELHVSCYMYLKLHQYFGSKAL